MEFDEFACAVNKLREAMHNTDNFVIVVSQKQWNEYNKWYRRLWRWVKGK